jgi:GH24 family phage-related lysozyme (muramidase)
MNRGIPRKIIAMREKNANFLHAPSKRVSDPTMTTTGLLLIQKSEGCSLVPYVCPGGVVTIGYGSTRDDNGYPITLDHQKVSQQEAEDYFNRDILIFSIWVKKLIKVAVSNNQFSALVSLAYNIGTGNLRASTLLRKLNRGDYEGCAGEFWKWRRSKGVILPGLVTRREMERRLFIT